MCVPRQHPSSQMRAFVARPARICRIVRISGAARPHRAPLQRAPAVSESGGRRGSRAPGPGASKTKCPPLVLCPSRPGKLAGDEGSRVSKPGPYSSRGTVLCSHRSAHNAHKRGRGVGLGGSPGPSEVRRRATLRHAFQRHLHELVTGTIVHRGGPPAACHSKATASPSHACSRRQ